MKKKGHHGPSSGVLAMPLLWRKAVRVEPTILVSTRARVKALKRRTMEAAHVLLDALAEIAKAGEVLVQARKIVGIEVLGVVERHIIGRARCWPRMMSKNHKRIKRNALERERPRRPIRVVPTRTLVTGRTVDRKERRSSSSSCDMMAPHQGGRGELLGNQTQSDTNQTRSIGMFFWRGVIGGPFIGEM